MEQVVNFGVMQMKLWTNKTVIKMLIIAILLTMILTAIITAVIMIKTAQPETETIIDWFGINL